MKFVLYYIEDEHTNDKFFYLGIHRNIISKLNVLETLLDNNYIFNVEIFFETLCSQWGKNMLLNIPNYNEYKWGHLSDYYEIEIIQRELKKLILLINMIELSYLEVSKNNCSQLEEISNKVLCGEF